MTGFAQLAHQVERVADLIEADRRERQRADDDALVDRVVERLRGPKHAGAGLIAKAISMTPEGVEWKPVPDSYVNTHDGHEWIQCRCGHVAVLAAPALALCPGECGRTFLNTGRELRAAMVDA